MKKLRNKILIGLVLAGGMMTTVSAKQNPGARPVPSQAALAKVAANCPNTTAQVDLDVNQVRARVLNGGDLWWDPVGQTPYYEVPIGSNKNAIFSGAIWIAGIDKTGQLKVAAQTYRQQGANDFWAGPLAKDPSNGSLNIDLPRCNQFDRFWSITRAEVEDFVATGNATQVIKDWPGNGNVSNGELPFLAPFFDANNDGLYNYTDGDYPYFLLTGDYPIDPGTGQAVCNDYIFGDRSLWWVFNDVGNVKTESFSAPIGLEIRAQAFAFRTADEINFMTFYKYQIINRSNDSLNQTYMGAWCDPDLGNAADDYVGCDVSLGLGFCYNGDPEDEGGAGYGFNPPAIGIDFFQGPLADANDGIDNDRDGVTDEPGEQIIMSKFVYYENLNQNPIGNPEVTDDYYDYLSGFWLDGQQITYGGGGRGSGPGATNTPCDFMFPDNTDPLFPTPWTMVTAGISPNDMRWLQSAGKFSLAPGAVNYIATGVIYAKTNNGGPLGSVNLVKLADQKAQALFDNCFKVLDGPDAPDLAIRELDKKVLITFENVANEKVEGYNQLDPTIPVGVPNDSGGVDPLSLEERSYKFQGYKLYQLLNENIGVSEIGDPSKAKLIAQVDIQDTIGQIVNYSFDQNLQAWVPSEAALNVNGGLKHSFEITTDLFSQSNLVNYRPYYFMAVSYAYNNYRDFDPNNGVFTQSKAYVQGRNNVAVYSAIPSKPVVNNNGTVFNVNYGDGMRIKRIEGNGNGGNVLDLTSETVDEILNSPTNNSLNPIYEAGRGPIKLAIYDPMKVKPGQFRLAFENLNDTAHWNMTEPSTGNLIRRSSFPISQVNDDVIEESKFTVTASKINGQEPGDAGATNNGFLEGTRTFSQANLNWLSGVQDASYNWIRSGDGTPVGDLDANGDYGNIIDGTWAPILLAESRNVGSPKLNATGGVMDNPNIVKWSFLNSVDVVFTSDKSKWTRSVVVELGEDSMPNFGAAKKFDKRKQASVDKDGNPGDGVVTTDPNDADFISATGMGWFPGYAINVETGERLNILFGENSALSGENSTDMLWNPTNNDDDDANGRLSNGGMHYIYVLNKATNTATDFMTGYDFAKRADSLLTVGNATAKRNVFKYSSWVGLPLLNTGHSLLETEAKVRLRVSKNYTNFVSTGATAVNGGNPLYDFELPGEYLPSTNQTELASAALENIRVVPNPYYAYSSYEKTRKDQLDNRVRITNLPAKCTVSIYNLTGTLVRQYRRDVSSDVSDGYLVQEGLDQNLSTTLDWDLKNTAGITVASGMYIIHVDAGALGERIVKWMGVMRPIDLDSF